jgi:hypothetical protein
MILSCSHLMHLMFFGVSLHFYYQYFVGTWEGILYCKTILMSMIILSVPLNHKHLDFIEQENCCHFPSSSFSCIAME